MIGLCARGHLTGTLRCACGAKRIKALSGDGKANVKKHQRPRDENGRNELDELRIATRVSGGGHMITGHNGWA